MEAPTRRPLIAGNWKMNGLAGDVDRWTAAACLAAEGTDNEVALFPPGLWIPRVVEAAEGKVAVGGQACHPEAYGAFTGALSATMLKDAGCTYVLCGHSERRHLFGETDAFVAASLARALAEGLTPVLCLGETAVERRDRQTEAVLERQLAAGLDALTGPDAPLVLAYEPVWAIGTGNPASAADAQRAHAFLRAQVAERDEDRAQALRILYGGSVGPDNIGDYLAAPDVDGALVGGAALDPAKFTRIVQAKATPPE